MVESPREAGPVTGTQGSERVIQDLILGHLDKGAAVRFTVISGSMQPLLRPGDTITVRAEPAERVHPGDVLLVNSKDGWLVHRLVARWQFGGVSVFATKGDNTPIADEVWRPGTQVAVAAALAGPSQSLELRNSRARWQGRAVAWLSRLEWGAYRWRPGPMRSAVLALLDRAIYICNRLIRWN